jgi:hypothetical protein
MNEDKFLSMPTSCKILVDPCCTNKCGGKDVVHRDETDDEADDSFHVGSERLEEDEELRLHILGVKSFFTKLRS